MSNAREIAVHILYDTEYKDAYANLVLKETLSKHKDLSQKDKGFITRLVYGTVSRRLTLEYIIEQYSKIKLKKISKYILLILKLGIYQIIYMDKVPNSAAVNESVKLAKRYGHSSSAGFVNGLLHSVIRNGVKYPDDAIQCAAYEYSYPVTLVKKWCDDFGYDFAVELMQAMNEDPEISLRVNSLKASPDMILKTFSGFSPSPYYENALTASGFDISGSELYKNGMIIAQDISAMLASVVLNPKKGEKVLDLCAAPGGKATHMAELMENEGEIIACDIHEHKTELIDKNARRMGIDIIQTVCIDSSVYRPSLDSRFDKVLADVPCSGWGIIKRKPDIKWKNPDMEKLSALSEKILTNAMKYVKIGGELVFSTCTINREENEERLNKLLSENDNFVRADITDLLPEGLAHSTAADGYVTFYPNVDGIDGFFIAKIIRCK
jgi:16S rRNA (cytosine967-C5)-methyltransferase